MKMLLPIVMINFFSEADYIAGRFYDEETLYRLATMLGWSGSLLVIIPLSHRLCYCFCDEHSSPLRETLTNICLGALVALMWVVGFFVNFRLVDSQVREMERRLDHLKTEAESLRRKGEELRSLHLNLEADLKESKSQNKALGWGWKRHHDCSELNLEKEAQAQMESNKKLAQEVFAMRSDMSKLGQFRASLDQLKCHGPHQMHIDPRPQETVVFEIQFRRFDMHIVLLFVVTPLLNAARVDLKDVRASSGTADEDKTGGDMKLQRLRAFNETGLRMLREGADLPLVTSFAETDAATELPLEWRSQLKIARKLGEGSFGTVYKCKVLCANTSSYVTVKFIEGKSSMVKREIKLLKAMRGVSDFCTSAIGSPSSIETATGYWIMMPLMNSGELQDLLLQCEASACRYCSAARNCWSKLGAPYTTPYMLALFLDVVRGVRAFHEKTGYLHADLKPENVMINCQGDGCFAAVIDLGLACDPRKGQCGRRGTPGYVAPEVWNGDPHGSRLPSRDVWALGAILYEVVYSNLPPFYADRNGSKATAYNPHHDPNIPQPPKAIDELVIQMLEPDFEQRPNITAIEASLEAIIYSTTDWRALNMVSESPSERGATTPISSCLSEHHEPGSITASAMPERIRHHGRDVKDIG
ncbi:CPK22 [Symbiodinium necroappetens]|uniref:CPK22 protein n=1 Tax=Symbiodinium necroappetens TaxID=1628268 RepID=A0A813C5P3_9DINO|nr:CPK22 [Symbiodinium necroappetens]